MVAAVRAGDDRAFEALFNRHQERIRRFVGRRIADRGRAEDVTQEVFFNALRRLRATDAPIELEPWLYEIARNACIDEHRRRARGAYEVALPDDLAELPGAGRLPSPPEPPAAADLRQRLADLRRAFGALSPRHHELIVLRELEGLSYDEIGARLGLSRPRVESSLFRARRRLGQEYAELISGRRCASIQALAGAGELELCRLGIRERRMLAGHLDHCPPCRRAAHDAGIDLARLRPPRITERALALAPLDWLRRRGADPSVAAGSLHGAGRAAAAAAAGIAAAIGGVMTVPGPPGAPAARSPQQHAAPAATPAGSVVVRHVRAPGTVSRPAARPTRAPGPRGAFSTARPADLTRQPAPRRVPVRGQRVAAPSSAPAGAALHRAGAASAPTSAVVQPVATALGTLAPGDRAAVLGALHALRRTVTSTRTTAADLAQGTGVAAQQGVATARSSLTGRLGAGAGAAGTGRRAS